MRHHPRLVEMPTGRGTDADPVAQTNLLKYLSYCSGETHDMVDAIAASIMNTLDVYNIFFRKMEIEQASTQFITVFTTFLDHDTALRVVRSAPFRTTSTRPLTEPGSGYVCLPSWCCPVCVVRLPSSHPQFIIY